MGISTSPMPTGDETDPTTPGETDPGNSDTTGDPTTGGSETDASGSESGGGPGCGDGVREGDEDCDDGNDVNNDGCTNACRSGGSTLWEHSFDSGNADTARSLSVNQDNEILAVALTGEVANRECSDWMRVYAANGDLVLTEETPVDYCVARFSAADEMAGFAMPNGTAAFNQPIDASLMSHTLAGQQLWSFGIDEPLMVLAPQSVAADPASGDVFFSGTAGRDGSSYYWSAGFAVSVEGGSVAWDDGVPGPLPLSMSAFDTYSCGPAALDGLGARLAVCTLEESDPTPTIYRYGATGVLSTTVETGLPAHVIQFSSGAPYAVAGGPEGEMVAANEDELVAFNVSGTETLRYTFQGPQDVEIRDVAVDSLGNIIFAARHQSASSAEVIDATVVKLDPAGEELWRVEKEAGGVPSIELLSDDSVVILAHENDGPASDLWFARIAP